MEDWSPKDGNVVLLETANSRHIRVKPYSHHQPSSVPRSNNDLHVHIIHNVGNCLFMLHLSVEKLWYKRYRSYWSIILLLKLIGGLFA